MDIYKNCVLGTGDGKSDSRNAGSTTEPEGEANTEFLNHQQKLCFVGGPKSKDALL